MVDQVDAGLARRGGYRRSESTQVIRRIPRLQQASSLIAQKLPSQNNEWSERKFRQDDGLSVERSLSVMTLLRVVSREG